MDGDSSPKSRGGGLLTDISKMAAWVALVVYCVVGSVSVAVESARMVGAQQDITYPESANTYVAVLGGRTGQLYRSFSSPPYVVQPFGPLFYAVNAEIARVANLDLDRTDRICRALSFGCYLLCGVVGYGISRELDFSKVESLLAGLMLLAQPTFLTWDATARPDLTCLLAMLLCLWFAIRAERGGRAATVASGFFAGLAFLLKQSGAGAPAAVAIAWGVRKKYKQVFVLSVSAAIPVLLMFGFLFWRHEPFLDQFGAFGKSIWSIRSAVPWMLQKRAIARLLFTLAIGAVGIGKALRGDGRAKLVASFVLTNLCLALLTIPQVGGDSNYFLPLVAGCSLLLPFAMKRASGKLRTSGAAGALAAVVLLAATYAGLELCRVNGVIPRPRIPFEVLGSVRVISDEPYYTAHGREPEMLDPYTLHAFELKGQWDPSEVAGKIHAGQYDVVILRQGHEIRDYRGVAFFGQPIIDSLNANYEVLCVARGTLVLKPRSREIGATPEMLGTILGPCVSSGADQFPALFLGASDR